MAGATRRRRDPGVIRTADDVFVELAAQPLLPAARFRRGRSARSGLIRTGRRSLSGIRDPSRRRQAKVDRGADPLVRGRRPRRPACASLSGGRPERKSQFDQSIISIGSAENSYLELEKSIG